MARGFPAAAAQDVGTAQVIVLNVFGNDINRRMQEGQTLIRDQMVRTWTESAAELVFLDNSQLVIGARSEVAEGVIVEEGSVLSMGVFIGASTKIVDRASGEIHQGRVPAYSVVVPGSLPGKDLPDGSPGPSLYCAVIVKTVDEGTRAKTSINDILRE